MNEWKKKKITKKAAINITHVKHVYGRMKIAIEIKKNDKWVGNK